MAGSDRPLEADDELLSAYLDDELAPEERARVEERLSTDPAARQLLDELRAVSQRVKELPPLAPQADLRDSVLQRAERALLVPPADEPASAGGPSSGRPWQKPTIGRTRRGWVWAALATAAALLIALIEHDPRRNADVPAVVALSDRAAPEAERELSVDGGVDALGLALERRGRDAATEPVPPTAAPEDAPSVAFHTPSAAPATGRSSTSSRDESSDVGGPSERLLERAPDEPAGAFAGRGGAAPTSGAERFRSALPSRSGGVGGALSSESAVDHEDTDDRYADHSAVPVDEAELLVVHVNVKPVALQNKVFDTLLLSNGIVIEEEADELARGERSRSTSPPDTPAEVEESRRFARPENGAVLDAQSRPARVIEQGPPAPQDVEVVLVEAPPSQIIACLADIKADSANYTSVSVEDELAIPHEGAKQRVAKTPSAADWKQYNRGQMPPQQKIELAPDNNLYYNSSQGQIALGSLEAVEKQPRQSAESKRMLQQQWPALAEQGRAKRVLTREMTSDLSRYEPASGAARDRATAATEPLTDGTQLRLYDESTWGFARRGFDQFAADGADVLRVLFVLSTEEPALPASTSSPAAPSPADEGGLRTDE